MNRFTFYLGSHRPSWLTRSDLDVPLFYSAPTIHRLQRERRRRPTVSGARWVLDSGAFMAVTTGNPLLPWHEDPDAYGGMAARVVDEVGILPDFAAPQDFPCEPTVRAITGLSVADQQDLTTASYEWLADGFPWIPWVRVVQGWTVPEYLRHLDDYAARGVDLSADPVVGLGSVCRRGSARPVVAVVQAIQAHAVELWGRPLRLHAFGINVRALREVAHLLASSDSLAWSDTARKESIRLPGCTHEAQYCQGCPAWALAWRDKVLAAAAQPAQLDLLTLGAAA
ncbi:deazapurine DNA modification protein DpdA family protein [Actinomadura opuntiae]|uniref:deazapurine DNA modification protein DpdA family protein n=1 Tax=Actinomadura sp. OS1-43 TaxID=604315 RepID=UPI00255A79D7|nr:hypothetical protein [Actinomadura sp. OS1-43]MDL4812748.1 hypothetical protein [Actinomadura sp. OS1-43]